MTLWLPHSPFLEAIDTSLARMTSALRELQIGGTMNLHLLRMILEDEDFKKGYYNTTFVEREIEYYKRRKELEEISEKPWYGRSDG